MPEAAISEYFYGDEAEQFIYFRIPRQLITDPRFKHLSTDAKLLYGMLLDRMSLSVKNGWYDEDGRVYIYYTVEEICGDMNCGRDKAMKMLADLDTKKGVGLIRRVRQGQGKPTKLYVKRFTTGAVPSQPAPPEQPPFTPFSGVDFSGVQKSISPTSASRESRRVGVEKTDPNYTNQNQTDFSYPDPSIYPPSPPAGGGSEMERYEQREQIKANIDYDYLSRQCPYDDVESLLELIVDVVSSTASTIRIGKEVLPAETVKRRFLQLDSSHIEYVIDSLKQTTTKINNIRAYLLTALYNAPVTIGPYYSAAVRHDFSCSAGNVALTMFQMDGATKIGTISFWHEQGRYVREESMKDGAKVFVPARNSQRRGYHHEFARPRGKPLHQRKRPLGQAEKYAGWKGHVGLLTLPRLQKGKGRQAGDRGRRGCYHPTNLRPFSQGQDHQ